MKTAVILLLLSLLCPTAICQSPVVFPEWRYATEKKEVGAALAYSMLLPGGGHVYTQRRILSIVFIGVEVGSVAWYFIGKNKAESTDIRDSRGRVIGHESVSYGPLYVFAIFKVFDIFLAPRSVAEFNSELADRLHLQVSSRGIGLQITL